MTPKKILATELHIALDDGFVPIDHSEGDRTPEYEGTLDLVTLESLTEAEIDDWKSYYQIIDADTFQSKFYPLLLMCLNPTLEPVRSFLSSSATARLEYSRKDLSWLKELAQRERARQRKFYEMDRAGGADLKASPGRHCTWCPLLLNGCPVAQTNPYGQMTAEERLRFAIWLQEAERHNTNLLKELMVDLGPIHYDDGNEGAYLADFVPTERKFYSYRDSVSILDQWFKTHPDEARLLDKLTISGLSSALKARKRSELAQRLASVVHVHVPVVTIFVRLRGSPMLHAICCPAEMLAAVAPPAEFVPFVLAGC